MSTESKRIGNLEQDAWKQAAARQAVAQLKDGEIVGLGSGTTALMAVDAIGERVKQGLHIVGVSTSEKTSDHARPLGIPLSTLAEYPSLDMTIDGADEVESSSLNLIKGGGGNLLREKIVAAASARFVIVVDRTKVVGRLGCHSLSIEVVPFGWQSTEKRLRELDARPTLRTNSDGTPYITDGGHYILYCAFGEIPSPTKLATELDRVVGVVEHGLFIGMASQVLVGSAEGVSVLSR